MTFDPTPLDFDRRPRRVGIVGGAGPFGNRVIERCAEYDIDAVRWPSHSGGDIDACIVLPDDDSDSGSPTGIGALDVAAARSGLVDATGAVPSVVVLVSSGLVYGASPDNPQPLTESSPLHPVPDCRAAVRAAELERVVATFPRGAGDRRVVLRPCLVVEGTEESRAWWARSQWAHSARRGVHAPPLQLVTLDDLVDAVVCAVMVLDGVYNVAPPGWLTAAQQRELIGGPVAASASRRFASAVGRVAVGVGHRSGGLSSPADAAAYLDAPWVLACDRLSADGWTATTGNAEALLMVDPPPRLDDVPARRRQELVMGAVAATAASGAAGLAGAWWRGRGGRSRRG